MNLLILNDGGLSGGGAETRLLQLLDYWHHSGFLEKVYVLQRQEAPQKILRNYIEVAALNDAVERIAYLTQLSREKKISLVQAHNLITSGPWIFRAIKKLRLPLVWFVHDFWSLCGTQLLFTTDHQRCSGPKIYKCSRCIGVKASVRVRSFRRHFKYVDLAITQTHFITSLHRTYGIKPKNWLALDPWIDLENFQPLKDEAAIKQKLETYHTPTLIYAGPMSRAKGADLALHSFVHILKKFPQAKLKMIGGETHHGIWAQDLAKKLGIDHNVIWISRMPATELALEMKKAHLMLFTSQCEEPFGLTWVQGLACECPLVAVETGSLQEIYQQEPAFELCKNDPQSVAKAAIKTLQHPEHSLTEVQRASSFIKHRFHISKAARILEDMYNTLTEVQEVQSEDATSHTP